MSTSAAVKEGEIIIDAYTHYAPTSLTEYLQQRSGQPLVFQKLFDRIPTLTDISKRLALMDQHHISKNVLVPLPWLACVPPVHSNAEWSLEACRLANQEMAEVVRAHPDRFIGTALLPTGHPDDPKVMMAAYNHAIDELGLDGVAIFVGPLSTPTDHPGYEPLYAKAEAQGIPIWVHPNRPQFYPDYEAYRGKGGSLHQIWNSLGWVYDTSVAMMHIAMAGVYQRYPNLKIISHHHGGMIPFFTERFTNQAQNFDDTEGLALLEDLRKFYCDTATFGIAPMNIRQALDFFGPGRVLFGTDMPMDMAHPGSFISNSMQGLEGAGLSAEERAGVLNGNFEKMMEQRYASKQPKKEEEI